MLTDDIGENTDQLCAFRIDASFAVLRHLRRGLGRVEYRGLPSHPRDDATAEDRDEAVRVTTCTEHEGAKLLVTCGQRLERRGRGLGADEVIVPVVFPTRLSARSMLRG